ncbi:MAG: alpha/beta hydrolase [Candidatus Peribacteraceae bacterium]|nr:alpha/beta hydrolase [Candidatus Peribacteraceae bacterium]
MPVVLVAGIYASGRSLRPLKKFLERRGWPVYLAPEQKNFAPLPELARDLRKRISKVPSPEVQIVAHSLGGLTSLAALQDSKIADQVKQVITLGSPFQGSPAGSLAFWERNRKFLKLGSEQLRQLTENHKINSKFRSLHAEFDELVFPEKVTYLPGARENSTVNVPSHAGLILAKKAWREITARLSE